MDQVKIVVKYAHQHHDQFLAEFKELLRIPSISTDPAYAEQVGQAADWLVDEMKRIGLQNCQVIPTTGHPVVYGDWLQAGPEQPTVLIYAHYDVQPVDPLEDWVTGPFEPTVRDDKLFARGSIDDKVGVFTHLKAIESVLQTVGQLPINVKLIFEGEEEIGSPSAEAFIQEHQALLAADVLVLSDGGSPKDQPLMTTSIRGMAALEVEVTGPERDLHSGAYGGVVHNPVHLVGKIIGALHDEAGRIQVPRLYDDVLPLTPQEQQAALEQQQKHAQGYEPSFIGVPQLWGQPEEALVERFSAQPSCDVNGVYGGYSGPGTKTIIPSQAGFKLTLRLVANQDPKDVAAKVVKFIEGFAVPTLDLKVEVKGTGWFAQSALDSAAIRAAAQAIETTWGQPPAMVRNGGSVPIIGLMQRVLNLQYVPLGFGDGKNVHAPNEYLHLSHFGRGIDTAIHFYFNLAEQWKEEGPGL